MARQFLTALDMGGNAITAVGATTSAVVALGTVSGTVTCDLSQGTVFTATISGDTTFQFSGWPSGGLCEPVLYVTQDSTGGYTISVTGVTWEPNGVAPAFATAAGSVNIIPLSSPDEGTTIYGETGAIAGTTAGTFAAGNDSRFVADSDGDVTIPGFLKTTDIQTVTSNYTIDAATDYIIFADTASAAITITLPNATTCEGQQFVIKNLTGSNTLTVNTADGQVVDGSLTSISISGGYTGTTLLSDGTNWHTFGSTGWFNQVGVATQLSAYAAEIWGGLNMEGTAITDVGGLTVSSGVAAFEGGTDTSGTATESSVTFTSGTAKQLSTTQDVMLYIDVTTAVTASVAIGPTSTPAYTIMASKTQAIGLQTIRVPKGWYVDVTCGTMSDLTCIAITC
jgi:hypothetical protein